MSDGPNDWVVPDEGATLDDPYAGETEESAREQWAGSSGRGNSSPSATSSPQGPPSSSSMENSTSSSRDTTADSVQQEFYENEDLGGYDDASGIDLNDADMGSLDSDNSVGTWIFVLFGVLWFFFAVCGECM